MGKVLVVLIILALPFSAWAGVTYYVSNANPVGSDSNSGTSTSTPWLTINKVNTSIFNADDQILFNTNCIWREQLQCSSSGTSGHPIIYGTYGTGTAPIICGSVLLRSGWSQYSENVWQVSISTEPNIVYFNGARGTQAAGATAVTPQNNWYWASNVLYVWSPSGSPGSYYTYPGVEAGNVNYGVVRINDKSYVNFNGITVRDGNSDGVRVGVNSVIGVVFQGCTVERNMGQGFYVGGAITAQDLTINNCTIQNNEQWGIYVDYLYADGTISNCTITGNGWNSVADDNEFSGIEGRLGHFDIFSNIISNIANNGCKTGGSFGYYCHGIYADVCDAVTNIYNNTVYGNANGDGIKVIGSANVYKNMIYDNAASGIECGQNGSTNVVYDIYYNIIYYNNSSNGAAGITEDGMGSANISLTILNNTVFQNSNTSQAEINIFDNVGSLTIENNLLWAAYPRRTLSIQSSSMTGTVLIDHNLHWRADGVPSIRWENTYPTWSQWLGTNKFDTHGVNLNPLLVAPLPTSNFKVPLPPLMPGPLSA